MRTPLRSFVPAAVLLLVLGCSNEAETPPTAAQTPAPSAPTATPSVTPAAAKPTAPTVARSSVAENPEGWPPVEFEPPVVDWGIVEPQSTHEATVKIHNVGAQPLRIVVSRTSCGCTTTEDLGGRIIEPGGFIEFPVSMKMKSGLGQKREAVRILFDGYGGQTVDYYFTAVTSLPVQATPPYLTATETLSGTVRVTALDGRPFTVLRANGSPPQFVDFDPATDPIRTSYELAWDLGLDAQMNKVRWFWVVETDHPDAPLVDVRIRHDSTRPARTPGRTWAQRDLRVVLGVARPGETVSATTPIDYAAAGPSQAQPFRIINGTSKIDVRITGSTSDERYLYLNFDVTLRDVTPGLFYETITLESAGFNVPLVLIGRIEAPGAAGADTVRP